jgi:RNA polymerase-associated protein CTR9
LKKFYYNKDANILLFLARAYFESQRYEECKSTLSKALHLSPHSKSLWFNIALCQEQYALGILKKEKSKQTIAELRKAMNELQQAISTFERLSALSQSGGPAVQFIVQRAAKHGEYCQTTLEQGKKMLVRVEEMEKNAILENERKLRENLTAKEQKLKEEQERKRLEEDQRIREEENAKKTEEKLAELKQKWEKEHPQLNELDNRDTPKKKSKKRKEDDIIDDSELPEVQNEPEEPEESLETRRAKSLQDLKERQKKDKKKKRKHKDGESDEEKKKKKEKKKEKKKKRIQAWVSDGADKPQPTYVLLEDDLTYIISEEEEEQQGQEDEVKSPVSPAEGQETASPVEGQENQPEENRDLEEESMQVDQSKDDPWSIDNTELDDELAKIE